MPSIDDYYIKITIKNKEALANLDANINNYRNQIAKSRQKMSGYKKQSSKNNIKQYIQLLTDEKNMLLALRKQLTSDGNSELNQLAVYNSEKFIVRNIKRRFNRKYKSEGISNEKVKHRTVDIPRTGRYKNALNDPEFMKSESNRLGIHVGIVSREKMDQWTNIHINAFGKSYSPPTSYGEIVGYWMFHEFFGAGPKVNFKSQKSALFVVKNVGLGGFKRDPIMTNADGELHPEDSKIMEAIQRDISKMFKKKLTLGAK